MLKRELKAASFTTHFAAAHETRHLLHHLLALLKLLHKTIYFCNIHSGASVVQQSDIDATRALLAALLPKLYD